MEAQKAMFTSIFELKKIFHNCSFLMLKTPKEHYKCIAGAVVYNMYTIVTRCAPWKVFVQSYTCVTVLVLPRYCWGEKKLVVQSCIVVLF